MIATTRQTDKLRYIYLGRTTHDKYVYLESDLAQRKLLTAKSFTPDPTDWGGCDDLDRVCKIASLTPRDHLPLTENLTFYGTDYDHGHEYSWSVEVNMIVTVE